MSNSNDNKAQQSNRSQLPRHAVVAFACVCVVLLVMTSCRSSDTTSPSSLLEKSSSSPWFALVEQDKPRIVWLLTMPNAGTSHIMVLVQRATGRSMATNYGDVVTSEGGYSLSIHPRNVEGPYWPGLGVLGSTPRTLPEEYVLVETYCKTKTSSRHASLQEFVDDCRTTYGRIAPDASTFQQSHYPVSRVHKLVHLVRSPLTQLVETYERVYKSKLNDKTWRKSHPNTKEGLKKWCSETSAKYDPSQDYYATETRIIQATPCYDFLLDYINWHNRAFELTASLNLPELVVYYEDFASSDSLEQALDTVSNYLELERLTLPEAKNNEPQQEYFDSEEQKQMRRLLHALATPTTWKHVQHYFEF